VRAKGVLRNLRWGNYAKVVAALQVREGTLAEYFPKAEIIGADINPAILLRPGSTAAIGSASSMRATVF
jgi:hypothetical protein